MWTRELSLPLTHPNVLDTGINPYHQRETDGYSLELTFEQDGYDITSLTLIQIPTVRDSLMSI